MPKIVSVYNQEIPQSQTADKPMAPQERATQQPRDCTVYRIVKLYRTLAIMNAKCLKEHKNIVGVLLFEDVW